jgi:hypothetical protein
VVNNKTWLLPDNTVGSLQFLLPQQFSPTFIELLQTQQDGRGTKSWRYNYGFGDGGIANFSYADPATGTLEVCDALCPLPSANATWQRFYFVNYVSMNAFSLGFQNWYGDGAGLDGLVLFANAYQEGSGGNSPSATSTIGVAATATGFTPPSNATTGNENTSRSSSLSSGAKAGIGVGVALGVILLLALVVGARLFARRRRRQRKQPEQKGWEKPELEAKQAAFAEMAAPELERHELPADERPVEVGEAHNSITVSETGSDRGSRSQP